MPPDKSRIIEVSLAFLMIVLGASSLGIGIYGLAFAKAPSQAEYQDFRDRCRTTDELNESERQTCLNVSYSDYKSTVSSSFFQTPFTLTTGAFWIGWGLLFVLFPVAGWLHDRGVEYLKI